MNRKALLIGIGVITAGALGVGGYLYSTLDNQTEAKASSALDEFRASKTPDGASRAGLPKQGVYRYTVTGNEKIVRAPAIDVSRTFPTEATALIRHRADGYEFETRYSKEHTELSRYELTGEGAYVTYALTKLIVGPIKTDRERTWTPKLLRLPAASKRPTDPTWGGQFTAGDLTLSITNRYLPKETITVGGAPVPVDVIESKQDITGEYTGKRTEKFWFSQELGLIVRYSIASSLKGPTDLDFTADQTLVSTTPEV